MSQPADMLKDRIRNEAIAAKEDPLLHDALLFQFVVIVRGGQRSSAP